MRRPIALLVALCGCSEYEIVDFESADVFYQLPAEEVDILLVVDNSCSMSPYQVELGRNFNQFISWFIDANVDYHIGVTTTTIVRPQYDSTIPECSQADLDAIPAAGRLVDGIFLTQETENAATLFQDMVTVGTCGAGSEMGLEAARVALSEGMIESDNAGFLRPEADLSVIFVSDEQDASPDPVNTYINDLYEVKGQREREAFNASALAVENPLACGASSGSTAGTRYIDVARQTRGVLGDLCADDFEGIVTELSLNASRLRETFFLTRRPDLNTLTVTVEDIEWPCTDGWWTYDLVDDAGVPTPAITFTGEHMPQPGEQITVHYNQGDGDPVDFCPEASR